VQTDAGRPKPEADGPPDGQASCLPHRDAGQGSDHQGLSPGGSDTPGRRLTDLSGTTRVVAVFGHPVAHSLSPAMQNAAFDALGLDWVYIACAVPPEAVGTAVAAIRALGWAGANVTIPHKAAVVPYLDEVDDTVRCLGAANTIRYMDGRLTGYNTDGPGFLRSLEEGGHSVGGKRVAVLGAGGACRAVAHALAHAGAHVHLLARRPPQAEEVAALVGRSGAPRPAVHDLHGAGAREAVGSADVVVDTTSHGMAPHVGVPPVVPEEWLRAEQVVCDLTYNPRETTLLKAAQRRGASTVDGTGMLVQQGAIAFEHWVGRPAPVEAMRAALLAALESRQQAAD